MVNLMNAVDELQVIIADFFEVAPDQVRPDFPLAGPSMSRSIARASLDAAIRRRLGIQSPAVYTVKTYGELATALFDVPVSTDNTTAEKSTSPQSVPEGLSGLQCGIDLEFVENLPPITDCWEQDFYKTHFTSSEIAYCLLQEDPRMHFAGRWAAKEALGKCIPLLLQKNMTDMELVSDGHSVPFLQYFSGENTIRLPVSVSLSLTPQYAVGIVIAETANPQLASALALESWEPHVRTSWLVVLCCLVSLALAVWALLHSYHFL